MIHTNSHHYLAGIVAGLLAVAITVAAFSSLLTFLILGCLISTPIFVAAFGWGTVSSLFAMIIASFTLGLIAGPLAGVILLLLCFLPAFYVAWLLGLAKTEEQSPDIHWYPLANAVFLVTIFLSLVTLVVGIYFINNPVDPQLPNSFANTAVEVILHANLADRFDIEALRQDLAQHFISYTASAIAGYSLLFLIANLYFSCRISAKMKRLSRPRDNWPQQFRLPFQAVLLFIIAFALSFIRSSEILVLTSFVFSSAFGLVFMISGCAYMHHITRGLSARIIILILSYFLGFIFTGPFAFIVLGIWATIRDRIVTTGGLPPLNKL